MHLQNYLHRPPDSIADTHTTFSHEGANDRRYQIYYLPVSLKHALSIKSLKHLNCSLNECTLAQLFFRICGFQSVSYICCCTDLLITDVDSTFQSV